MIGWGRQTERAVAAAIAVLLQAALYLTLTHHHAAVQRGAGAPTLIAMILAVARPHREAPTLVKEASELRQRRLLLEPSVTLPIVPSGPEKPASGSGFDWERAIQGEVGEQLTRPAAPPKLRFDFPVMPVEKARPHWDGWDEVHIDRAQRLAHGIIDLGHGCAIVLWFPIPQCHAESASGDLFDHMRDRPDEGPGALP